jgi:tetratricopeptide (TPR) repeat protein
LKTGFLADPVLVGREREFEELQHHLDLAIQGKGTTVFISGEAGSGKTRLVKEFLLTSKKKREINDLAGWCLSNSGIPYFPFIEAFNAYSLDFSKKNRESVGGEEFGLKAWLMGPGKTEKSRELENLSPQAWKDSTFAAVTKALRSISAKKPTILFIDDLQWADTASLALLQYISRFIASERVLVLSTFRSEDLTPDSEGRPHPLVDTLRLMGRESLFEEIKLPSLSHPDVSLLAEDIVGGRIQSEFAQKLVNESQGNPLFVVETLRMLSEKGSLIQENGRWRLSIDEIGIPVKIKDIILRRVSALKAGQRKILDIASVIGSKFNPELLGAVLSLDSLETLETLNTIEKSTSLVVCEGSYYSFCHAKCRDALYEEISPPLRKAYHGRVAERLESAWKGIGKVPVGDLAFHYAQAGNKEKAVKYALAAGEEALAIFSGAEAIKQFRYVLDATSEDIGYTDERTTALEGLGDGLFSSAKCGEAIKVFEQLGSSTKSSLVKLRAIRKAIRVSMRRGDYAYALKLSEKAMENTQVDRLECARARLFKGMVKNWGGKYEEAIQDMEKSLKVFEEEFSLPDMTDMLAELAWTYRRGGQHENAIAAALRACALGEYARNLGVQGDANITLCYIFTSCGLQKEAMDALAMSFKIDEKVSDPVSRAWNQGFGYWLSGFLLEANAAGKIFSGLPLIFSGVPIESVMSSFISGAFLEYNQGLKAAVVQSLKGTEYAEVTDSYFAQSLNYSNLARQYAESGDMEQAEQYYKKLVKIFDETSLAGYLWAYALFSFSRAVLFSSKGQWNEANKFYEEALRVYRNTGLPCVLAAGAMQSYSYALLQQGRFADAKMHFEEAKSSLTSLEKRFEHSHIQGYLIAPIRVEASKDFDMRLDLVNVSKSSDMLIRVEGVIPYDFKVTAIQPNYSTQNGSVDLEKKSINPFTDEAITFTVQATKPGDFTLNPQLIYVNDLGETKTFKITPVNITVQLALE